MKMRPLLCAAPIVRNLLNVEIGSWPAKAIDPSRPIQFQDRRPIKDQSRFSEFLNYPESFSPAKIGEALYVRENFWEYDGEITRKMLREGADTWPVCAYSADCTTDETEAWKEMGWKQRPSIHMPRELSRLHLEVMRVRVERACDISEEDARAEGCNGTHLTGKLFKQFNLSPVQQFKSVWGDLYGPDAWEKWVWIYDFRRIK